MAREGRYDVLIVDRMLPRRDGLSVVQTLRAEGARTPVLILSALGEVDDRVKGLRAGGDDYLTKPYAYTELLARIEALARRPGARGAGHPLHASASSRSTASPTRSRAPASRSRCSRASSACSSTS